jgi:hypothetical protein
MYPRLLFNVFSLFLDEDFSFCFFVGPILTPFLTSFLQTAFSQVYGIGSSSSSSSSSSGFGCSRHDCNQGFAY